MRRYKVVGREKLVNMIRGAREVPIIKQEYSSEEAYLYKDVVYVFSRDGKYYYKMRYEDYEYLVSNNVIRKKRLYLVI